jgi:uncharacterized protein (TIGR03435 family)
MSGPETGRDAKSHGLNRLLFRCTRRLARNQRPQLLDASRVDDGRAPRPVRTPRGVACSGFSGISGGSTWIGEAGPSSNAARFDVTAKADAPSSHDQLQMMLRTLLADRFKLVVHTETKDEPVYALVLARSDGHLGPQLHPEERDCEPLRAVARAQPGGADPCGTPSRNGVGRISARSKSIDLLAAILRGDLDRPVVNKTGLTGSYDWDLTWTPRQFLQSAFDHDQFPTIDPDGPSVFTAVQEQLGLKFVSEKEDQPGLVIDHVEQPTPD